MIAGIHPRRQRRQESTTHRIQPRFQLLHGSGTWPSSDISARCNIRRSAKWNVSSSCALMKGNASVKMKKGGINTRINEKVRINIAKYVIRNGHIQHKWQHAIGKHILLHLNSSLNMILYNFNVIAAMGGDGRTQNPCGVKLKYPRQNAMFRQCRRNNPSQKQSVFILLETQESSQHSMSVLMSGVCILWNLMIRGEYPIKNFCKS
jgi:hypothetical protein